MHQSQPTGSALTIQSTQLMEGQPLEVSWRTDAPHETNWIGVYPPTAGTPDGNPASTQWKYAPGTSGTMSFEGLAPGTWLVYFLAQDKYGQLTAPTEITITAAGPGDGSGDPDDPQPPPEPPQPLPEPETEPIVVEPEPEAGPEVGDCTPAGGTSECVDAPPSPVVDQPEAAEVQPEVDLPTGEPTPAPPAAQQPESTIPAQSEPKPAETPEAVDTLEADTPQPDPEPAPESPVAADQNGLP